MKHPIQAKTADQLRNQATPGSSDQPEAQPWVLYHTETYTSGTTTQLTFFDAVQTPDNGNMDAASVLSSPKYFEWWCLGLDVLLRPSDVSNAGASAAGATDDIQNLVMSSRPHWTFELADKQLGSFPLSFLHTSGGATGMTSRAGTLAADDTHRFEHALNSVPDGGYWIGGAVLIPPQQSFNITVNWPSAVTLENGDTDLRMWMAGTLYRRVL